MRCYLISWCNIYGNEYRSVVLAESDVLAEDKVRKSTTAFRQIKSVTFYPLILFLSSMYIAIIQDSIIRSIVLNVSSKAEARSSLVSLLVKNLYYFMLYPLINLINYA